MASSKDFSLYVVRDRETGLFNCTGDYPTSDMQKAIAYSARKRDGTRRLHAFQVDPRFECLPVRLVVQ